MRLAQKRFVSLTVVLLVLGIAATGGFAILGMAPAAQIAFAILLVAATLWITEAVPLFVTSFVIVLLCLVWLLEIMRDGGIEASPEAFLAPFFSDIILLFLGGFVMASGLKAFRIDEDLARWILAKTGRSVPRLILGVMGVTALLSMWLSNTATAAMMLAICVPIAQRFPKDDRYRTALLLAIPLAANVGGLGTPIGTPPNAIAMQYLTTAGSAPSFTQWLVIGVPGVVVMLGVVFAILMVLYRGSTDRVELDSGVSGRSYGRREWFVLAVCTVTVVGWITSAWHGYSSGTVALIPVIAFFSTGVLSNKDLKALSWDVLLMMGGGLCLGRAMELSGLAGWLIEQLPVETAGLFGLAVVLSVAACAMSSAMSNTATANLIMPLILGLGTASRTPLLISVAFACSLAMPLPISTPPNAMAFSTGELHVRDLLRPGLLATVIGLTLALTTGWLWWDLVGVF